VCLCAEPTVVPNNFRLVGNEPYNGTFAEFAWDSVDSSPERVRGFFRGYRVSCAVFMEVGPTLYQDSLLIRADFGALLRLCVVSKTQTACATIRPIAYEHCTNSTY